MPKMMKQFQNKAVFIQSQDDEIPIQSKEDLQMATTSNHPYIGEFEKIQAIPKSQRAAYQKEVDQTKVREGKPDISAYEERFKDQADFSYGEHQLHYHYIEQTDCPSAIYVFVHGFNSHGGRSYCFARRVTELNPNANFFAFDQMNFGQSTGDMRGFLHPVEEEAKQGEAFLNFVLARYANLPKVFLVGNSFGGPICVEMALRKRCSIDGVIFLTPAFRQNDQDSYISKVAVQFLACVLPKIAIPIRVGEGRSTKYDLTEQIRSDPFNICDIVIPGTYNNAINAVQKVQKKAPMFTTPFITFMAGREKVMDLFGSVDFHQASCSGDKTTICCPKMWHSATYEEQIETIAQISASWVQERL